MTYDTIIIGAGLSGLAAGVRLAHFGQRVCILERHSVVGGLNSYYRRHGREFDVGLHAFTNFRPKGARVGPLARLLKQLRLTWDELALAPHVHSAVAFPDVRLEFTNDCAVFESEVRRVFPDQVDALRQLIAVLVDFDDPDKPSDAESARQVVAQYVSDPLLVEMLFCPVSLYSGSAEYDMPFRQFSIIFRSLFLEGLSRPVGGIRPILTRLVERFRDSGGELRLRAEAAQLDVRDGSVRAVVLANGEELSCRRVISSAGWRETIGICGVAPPEMPSPCRMTCFETISVLDREPREFGFTYATVFFNDSPRFEYCRPDDFVNLRSGLIASPNNYANPEPLPFASVRVCAVANYDRWAALDRAAYVEAKRTWHDKVVASAVRFIPDFRSAVIDVDAFTPITLRRFTGHENGAVYGTPNKRPNGATHLENLFLCGNDQGLVGIVGTLLSGILIANRCGGLTSTPS